MSVQIGSVARDDPFFEGIDLAGVSTNMTMLRDSMEAYRQVFDQRLQEKFKAKALTLRPFGPQVFFCNKPIKSIADFKGLKIRSFTPSMSAMLQNLGATPVTPVLGGVLRLGQRRGGLWCDLGQLRQLRQVA